MQKRYLHLIVGVIIVIYSLYYAFKDISIQDIGAAFHLINYSYVLLAVVMVAISFLFRAVRWRYLIASVKTVKTTSLYSPLMVGFMGNMLPARAGEFIRAYLLSQKERISYTSSFATIFVERLFDLFIVLVFIMWLVLFNADIFTDGNSGNYNLMAYMLDFGWFSFVVFSSIFLFLILFQFKNDLAMKLVNFCIKPLPDIWHEKIRRLLNAFVEGLAIVKNKKRLFLVVLYTFLICIAILLSFYFLYLAFNIDTKLPVIASLILLSLAIDIFITLFPTPGFLGSFHSACIVVLHEIFKLPKALALSYGIVAWLVLIGFAVLMGAGFVIKDNISFNEFPAAKKVVE